MTAIADRVPPNPISQRVLDQADLCTFNWNTQDGYWNDANLLGASIYVQAVLSDAGANPFGLTTTNGGHAGIGG